MAKLKNIVKQLAPADYETIYKQLIEGSADKSAYLLKAMREKHLTDAKIMEELDVNTNAYYTLRSRLNQKIEEYLVLQMESPRTDLLKKVSNINETVFTKKRAISIATLKKLEKELLDYDLQNELTVVYKTLKKLHVNSPEHYTYSQAYNRHVAFMLAVDKAEDMLAEYFRKFGSYSLTGDETEKLGLILLQEEMSNASKLYDSRRMYVYQSCLNIFHRLFVEEEKMQDDIDPVEDILKQVDEIFDSYKLDSIYHHLEIVFDFLKLEYYSHYKLFKKAEKHYEDVNEYTGVLLANYSLYTYPSQFLATKIERALRLGVEAKLYEENEGVFEEFEYDPDDIPKYINYVMYRALCCYYVDKYQEASKWINSLINDLTLKKYQYASLEIKSILALQYCLLGEIELFNQLVSSIQRQLRLLGKENYEHILLFNKILKTAVSDAKRDKPQKIKSFAAKLAQTQESRKVFSPTKYIKFDDKLVKALCKIGD
jgi:hypothetical protein